MKCPICGADATVTIHTRKKRKGETHVMRCSAGHTKILKLSEREAAPPSLPLEETPPPSAIEPEAKKKSEPRTLFEQFVSTVFGE